MDTKDMRKDLNQEQSVNKLRELIKGIKVAMLTTLNNDGTFHTRPMWTQQADFDGNLWFFTSAESPKAQELRKDSHVTVAYADPEDERYISVYGWGEIVRDRNQMEKLWSPQYEAWFPQGLDDPNVCLIKVAADRAEYWDSPTSKIVHLLGFAKARVTGKPYEPSKEERGKLDIAG